MNKLTHDRLIAACECIRLIGLLVESKGPHSKELAMIVSARLRAIVEAEEDPEPLTPDEVQHWYELACSIKEE